MCHVIVTCRSMLWTLLSIVVAFAELIAFMSADWLIGKAKPVSTEDTDNRTGGLQEPYHPTLGIYGRCTRISHMQLSRRDTLCGPYAENFSEIASGFWQATAIFLAVGILILCAVAFVSVFTMCVQSIMKKSIFNVCGLLQGIAVKLFTASITLVLRGETAINNSITSSGDPSVTYALVVGICIHLFVADSRISSLQKKLLERLFLILGLILYPAGWGCQKAISYCGHYASAYKLGDCSLGWAFYTAIGGTILTFICAVFSAQAEIATSSDKVQEEIEEGKNLICLL